jgi:hypothetical protein
MTAISMSRTLKIPAAPDLPTRPSRAFERQLEHRRDGGVLGEPGAAVFVGTWMTGNLQVTTNAGRGHRNGKLATSPGCRSGARSLSAGQQRVQKSRFLLTASSDLGSMAVSKHGLLTNWRIS